MTSPSAQIEQAALSLAKEFVFSSRYNKPTNETGVPLDVADILLSLPCQLSPVRILVQLIETS